ncbi:MAG TPA: prolyl oligopeptidase family serine peptidase [Terriglobia bacterium]|nr:prolyl oligopeptidase family serine peptidase [Terriglobia bacterium]
MLRAQATSRSVELTLEPPVQPIAVTAFELQRYLMRRIPKLPPATSASEWKAEVQKLRRHMLEDIAYHGWPREWVDAAPKFEDVGVIETGKGYRLRKLRYEIVPGYESTAILYEPGRLSGRAPAILNVHGHEPLGKAAEYKQKRCINFAKRGILALSLEWPGFGELNQPENAHDYGAHLDLIGANALGFFYLAMRRGLDYLASRPDVDIKRLGVTGLSGGGWQTIVLSALDERVAAAVEVAGFGSLESNLTHPVDTDEVEEDPSDFTDGEDYTTLTAMRAPRPTLLIHNAEDNCCFRAALVKPYTYDQIRPFFRLLGAEDALAFHENRDPGTHNYQLDNREQAYRFFTQHFGLPVATSEIPSDAEIKTLQELTVGLPAGNLTIAGLARKLAAEITRPAIPTDQAAREIWVASGRERLRSVLRLKPVTVENAWRIWNTKNKGVETLSYRFDFSDGLSATGTWLKAIAAPPDAPSTIVLNDKGKKAAGDVVADRVNRGEQVLALEPLFNGATIPQQPDSTDWEMLVATTGDRPLGLQVAQLLAVIQWMRPKAGGAPVRIETTGIRTQVVALVAAALEPSAFSSVVNHQGMRSLSYLLDTPVPFRTAPELFCLDFYKYFDVDRLTAMAAPVSVTTTEYVETAQQKKPSD